MKHLPDFYDYLQYRLLDGRWKVDTSYSISIRAVKCMQFSLRKTSEGEIWDKWVFLKDFHFHQFHVTEFFPRPKIHVMLDPLYVIFLILITYCKVASTSPSCLEAHAGFFRLSMNGKFFTVIFLGKVNVHIINTR